jgi:hypothetical protein
VIDTLQADFQAGTGTNVDLTASPGDVVLTHSAESLDQQQAAFDSNWKHIKDKTWRAQSFKPAVSGILTGVDLYLSYGNGPGADLIVEVRNSSGTVPTTLLASASISGIANLGFYTANFSSPPTLIAGTTYHIVVHTSAATTYNWSHKNNNPYANGNQQSSNNNGVGWTVDAGNLDYAFKTYMSPGYAGSGNLVSSAKDANPAVNYAATWTTLSWTATTPASTTVQFQAAGSNSPSGPFNFVGPDGTANTFFTTSGASLGQFNGFRYLQYNAFLSTTDTSSAPVLRDVTACYSNVQLIATSLAADPASGAYGGTTNLSATLTSGGPGLGGKSINFVLDGSPVGSATTDASGVATLSNVSLGSIIAGTYPSGVGASFAGDATYTGSGGTNSLTLAQADQTITFGALANTTYGDGDFTVSATASSGLDVSFAAAGQCTMTGNTAHITGAGSCTVTSSQTGNTNYNAAPDVDRTFSIAQASTATSVSSSNNSSVDGESVTFTGTVTSGVGTPAGTVTFKDGASTLGAGALNGSGEATYSTSALSEGDHSITAWYEGNADLTGSNSPVLTQTVSAPPTFSIDSVTHNEGNSGTTEFVFTVTKTGNTALNTSVDFATGNGSGTVADNDYQATSGTLTFSAAETAKTITVLANGDRIVEPNETFMVHLANAVGASITNADGTGTIVNDDHAPVADNAGSSTNQNTVATITLSATDADGDILTFSMVDDPAHGTLGSISTPSCSSGACTATVDYTPADGYIGSDSFTYKTSDGVNDSNTATVSITVNHVVPVVTNTNDSDLGSLRKAVADSLSGDTIIFDLPAGPNTIVLASEVAIDKDLIITGPANGALTVSGGGVTRVFSIGLGNTVTLSDMTIADGAATDGGAIQNTGDLSIFNSTLSGNNATGGGGAIGNDGTLNITNSTLSDNHATGAGSDGGAILNGIGHTATLGNVTLVKNTAGRNGGGINSGGTLNLKNSIIALNAAGMSGNNVFISAGAATSSGYNLSNDDGGGFLTNTGDQINTDPILGPLKNNGGLSFTHAPLSNSPAIDTGKDLGADGNPTVRDQRGSVRPVTYDAAIIPPAGGDRSDIGAVELPPGVLPVSAVSRKTHGAAGDFDINLPLTGIVGVECRIGGATNDYKVVLTFASPVTFSSAAVNDGAGSVAASSGSGTTTVTVDLTGVTNAQRITLALFGVDDTVNNGDVGVRVGMLIGDTTGNGHVNASDIAQTKVQSGQSVSGSNFRTDVTANGAINASDIALMKTKSGTSLP